VTPVSDFDDKLNSILSSPKDMEKIMDLARQLSGETSHEEPKQSKNQNTLGDFDPKLIGLVQRVMSEYTAGENDKKKLIDSLKPYVKEERRDDLDRAVKLAKLYRAAKVAFSEFGGDFHL
jgi:hypothetical protein